MIAHHWMMIFLEREHAVVPQPGWAAPHHNVAMRQPDSNRLVTPIQSAEQEHCRDSKGDRDDRLAEILLVFVLMQRKACPGLVAIDQTCIRCEPCKSGFGRGGSRQSQ